MGRPYKKIINNILLYLFMGLTLFTVSLATIIYTKLDINALVSQEWLKYLIGIIVNSLMLYYLKSDFDEYL